MKNTVIDWRLKVEFEIIEITCGNSIYDSNFKTEKKSGKIKQVEASLRSHKSLKLSAQLKLGNLLNFSTQLFTKTFHLLQEINFLALKTF